MGEGAKLLLLEHDLGDFGFGLEGLEVAADDVAVGADGEAGGARPWARAPCAPVWIVLEYLSAEPWVPAHHGLPSPHPRVALEHAALPSTR